MTLVSAMLLNWKEEETDVLISKLDNPTSMDSVGPGHIDSVPMFEVDYSCPISEKSLMTDSALPDKF